MRKNLLFKTIVCLIIIPIIFYMLSKTSRTADYTYQIKNDVRGFDMIIYFDTEIEIINDNVGTIIVDLMKGNKTIESYTVNSADIFRKKFSSNFFRVIFGEPTSVMIRTDSENYIDMRATIKEYFYKFLESRVKTFIMIIIMLIPSAIISIEEFFTIAKKTLIKIGSHNIRIPSFEL